MTNLEKLRRTLKGLNLQGFLLPSSDEYLSEYAQPAFRRLRWATGFTGSTGTVAVLQDSAALIVDGRYVEQGARDTAGLGIDIVGVDNESRQAWFAAHLDPGSHLGIDGRLHPYSEMLGTIDMLAKLGIEIVDVPENPIDALWKEGRPSEIASPIHDYPVRFAGLSREEKCAVLGKHLTQIRADWHLIADPEDIAWLLNIRTDDSLAGVDAHPVPIPLCRALAAATGRVHLFVDEGRIAADLREDLLRVASLHLPSEFESFLRENAAAKTVSTNIHKIPYRFAVIVTASGSLIDDQVLALRRWVKHPNEIEVSREAHYKDGVAIIRFLAWLQSAVRERRVSELDAAAEVNRLRQEYNDYRGNSMRVLSASGPNGALAHYVPSEKTNRYINDHPIYWLDSGGHYPGSTDNTVCFAVGTPEPKHVLAHTLVVKGWIALTRARFPDGIYSTQLDSFARQFLWEEGLDYGHGTSHGVGNFMNIHEGPYIRKEINHPLVTRMREGMIISNEPAYYLPEDFGVRVESHMVTAKSGKPGFLKFETLSKLPIDPQLIDPELLTDEEKAWLAEYHDDIGKTYAGVFDAPTSSWLNRIIDQFRIMAS